MRDEVKAAIVTVVLIIVVIVVFTVILSKPQNVVPLYLVPVFAFFGFVASLQGLKVWTIGVVVITIALSVLYALT